ncbi:MAG: tripartite tricarboxylate transporter TctB family protein [Thermodesulfobacteriota bacterium]
MKKSDAVIGFILLALALFYYLSTRDLPPPSVTEKLGASFFPILLTITLAVLSVLLLAGSFFSRDSSDEKAAVAGGERLEEDAFSSEAISYPTLLGTMGLSILYVALLNVTGYLATTPVFIIALVRLLGMRQWIKNIALSIILTAALYLLFGKALGVPLPAGIFQYMWE